jgi:membrane fusion protein (multidrug efflux system)
MSIAFSRSMRSLRADGGGRSLWPLGVAAALLGAWTAWFVLSRVTRYEITDNARLEVNRAAYLVQAPVAGRVASSALALGREIAAGDVLLEMDTAPQRLALNEARARLAAVEPDMEGLRRELAAQQQALRDAQQAGQVAVEQARAQTREAEAMSALAADEAGRLKRLKAEGLAADRDFSRAQAEQRSRRASVESLELAAARLGSEQRRIDSDREAQIEQLRTRMARLDGERATAAKTLERLSYEIERRTVRAPVAGRLGEAAVVRAGGFVEEGHKLGAIVPSGELRVIAEFPPSAAIGRIRPGQPARLRLHGFPWAQYGSIGARVESVGNEVRDGRVRVELSVRESPKVQVPLQHGLPGTVEVEVERISPASLVLRAAGQLLANPTSSPGNPRR